MFNLNKAESHFLCSYGQEDGVVKACSTVMIVLRSPDAISELLLPR